MAYDPQNPKGHYNTDVSVAHSVIDEIRELGMEQAIKKARSGQASPEFVEGVRRFYPAAIEDIESSLGGGGGGGQEQAPPRGDIADPPKIPTDDFATDGVVSNPPTSGGEFTPAGGGPPAPQVAPPGGAGALDRRLEQLGNAAGGSTPNAPRQSSPRDNYMNLEGRQTLQDLLGGVDLQSLLGEDSKIGGLISRANKGFRDTWRG